MGARAGRLVGRFNAESRAHREIKKIKPEPAPRHETHRTGPLVSEEIHRKDDPLLFRLKQVYVESEDPAPAAAGLTEEVQVERRRLKCVFPGDGLGDVLDVPVGKISIVEALKVLEDHKRSPGVWSVEKISQEFMLARRDAESLTHFFRPFEVKILPSRTQLPLSPAP